LVVTDGFPFFPLPILDDTADLYKHLYSELKRVAHAQRMGVGAHMTLSTTELVHEAYFKLAPGPAGGWNSRGHFIGSAARAMRQVLVDIARNRMALKRGGDVEFASISLGDIPDVQAIELDTIIILDAALERLEVLDPRLCQIVELRYFAGLPIDEIAALLGVVPRTVERNWTKARLFLLDEMR
jgi:RNA polymerase sigma factor (TIGR02999 family)